MPLRVPYIWTTEGLGYSMNRNCALMFVCGSLETCGPLQTLNLAHTDVGYVNIPMKVLRSPARLAAYIEELNLNTASSIMHRLGVTHHQPCPNRHAIYAVSTHKWIIGPLQERWHNPHPSVEDAYRLHRRIQSMSGFEKEDAKTRIKLLQIEYNEAMRAFLLSCANLQDEFATGHIADADIAIDIARARTREFLELAQRLHQQQLPQ